MPGLVSAAGVIGYLAEPEPEIKAWALKQLHDEVDLLWPEIADSVGDIEALYEDESFPERNLAAIVAAKVYYHLQDYGESMAFALDAGKYFKLNDGATFEETIIGKCVDTWIALSASKDPTLVAASNATLPELDTQFSGADGGAATLSASLTSPVTPFSQSALPSKSLLSRQNTVVSLEQGAVIEGDENKGSPEEIIQQRGLQKQLNGIIERLFEQCFAEKRYRQVIGIAVEARNLEVLRRVILRAAKDEQKEDGGVTKHGEELMEYVLEICMSVVQERGLRNEILKLILELLNDIPSPDYFAIAKCVVYLDQHSMASDILKQLVEKGDPRSLAVAYQISFDLYDNSTQEFLRKVREELTVLVPDETDENAPPSYTAATEDPNEQLQQELQDSAGTPAPTKTDVKPEVKEAVQSIKDILDGLKSIHLNIEFLNKSNRVDLTVLNKVKDSLEARNSIYHTAVTLCTGFMHAKTANDDFFRQNLEWLGKAVNWSKFTATAALGVIHQGNVNQVDRLLNPYLPKRSAAGPPSTSSPYSQGGSLYAYGLVCANHKGKAVEYIRSAFKDATEEVILHGGALGLGVAGMASGDESLYDDLKNVLYTDSAINGEAVGLAMGLVMLGSGNTKQLEDMIQYARETQHDKIIRGLAIGMAMIMYGRQEGADILINGLLGDADPHLRYGGILTIAMAYVGTGSNKAVRKLLHTAVSDVSDDVRRIAVLSLGFILFRKHTSVPRMVELLAESYNPHVRYGAAMALGISCAGTGLDEAIDLLEPMLKDPTDFVRQGALIALSMIMVQQNEAMNPKVSTIRKTMLKMISDRHEDAMCKFGDAMAMGIIDAGGRNCTISLQTQTGNLNLPGIVGAVVFTQYWYWHPLAHFLSLSFTPTAVIGVDQKLDVPVYKFHSNTRPSMFDYPPEQTAKVDEAPEKVKTAVLSTTAQAKRRQAKKAKDEKGDSMDVDTATPVTPKVEKSEDAAKLESEEAKDDEAAKKEEGEKPEKKKRVEKEKVGYEISNMSRVLPGQLKYLSFPDKRWQPVKKPITGGVMVVLDTQPDSDREIVPLTDEEGAEEAPVPREFDYESESEHNGDPDDMED
ncbi:26S proteasome regulatory subunit rpn2 [Cyphellophora attinorum]|uniref:26S proteasome regulatory subunit RPN2 n=1 Tax=Cyphellophora attinorum TaxID=1664694 RepID=A0A0N0NLT4_9EURO|nr:26S proteasome regulatory subunit rpn2 [Phialophora attinorum]KPI39671.1 26S proteasome regulatory subunit rpn2 [Phialophora attinorum]